MVASCSLEPDENWVPVGPRGQSAMATLKTLGTLWLLQLSLCIT